MIEIKTSRKDLFSNYLLWLNPILGLSDTERRILSSFITLHHAYKHYHDKEVLNSLLFSEETKKDLAKRLKINNSIFSKAFQSLESKGIIQPIRKV